MANDDILKQRLETLRDELQTRIDAIQAHDLRGRPLDWDDAAIDAENDQVLNALQAEAEDELLQIDEALQRLKNHRFGRCVNCQSPIEFERLLAIPFTQHCIQCAEK